MVKSRQDGIFSAAGLNGWGSTKKSNREWIPSSDRRSQYIAYLNDSSFENYTTYNSQPGGQGFIYSILDGIIPGSQTFKFWFFYGLTSLLTALVLTFVIDWFYGEFSGWVAVFVIVSVVLSQWLTVFGRSLWWSIWVFYLPMITVMYFLKHHRELTKHLFIRFGIILFISISIKCFINGYEYMTTTLLMMITPIVYYAIRNRWNRPVCLKLSGIVVLSSGIALILSFTMLCIQIGVVKGGFLDGVEHVFYSIGKRTYGNAEDFPSKYTDSLEAGMLDVVTAYFNGDFLNLNNLISTDNQFILNYLLKIRYSYLIVLFLVMSGLLIIHIRKKMITEHLPYYALIHSMWFSILAPISWFVIFKAHSYVHTHISFFLWQMPFTLFGFAVVGAVIALKLPNLKR